MRFLQLLRQQRQWPEFFRERLYAAITPSGWDDFGLQAFVPLTYPLSAAAVFELWQKVYQRLEVLHLPVLTVSDAEVKAGKGVRYLPRPACDVCKGTGIVPCPYCQELSSISSHCSHCQNTKCYPCHCVQRYVISIPRQALSGFIACGYNDKGERRYVRLVSPQLAARYRPVEHFLWPIIVAAALFFAAIALPLSLNKEWAYLGAVLLGLGALAAFMGAIRRRLWAWWLHSYLLLVTLLGAGILLLLLQVQIYADDSMNAVDVALVSLLILGGFGIPIFWLSRYFSPAVRGLYDVRVFAHQRIFWRVVPTKYRFAWWLRRKWRVWAPAAGLWMIVFVVLPIIFPTHIALPRAVAAYIVRDEYAVNKFTEPWIKELDQMLAYSDAQAEANDKEESRGAPPPLPPPPGAAPAPPPPPPGPAPPGALDESPGPYPVPSKSGSLNSEVSSTEIPAGASWPQKARTVSKRLAHALWWRANWYTMSERWPSDIYQVSSAAEALVEYKRLVPQQLWPQIPEYIAQVSTRTWAERDVETTRKLWDLLLKHFPDHPVTETIKHPAEPWVFNYIENPRRVEKLLMGKHLTYSGGFIVTRDIWRKPAEDEEIIIVPVHLWHIGTGDTTIYGSFFSLQVQNQEYMPLGMVSDDGCWFEVAIPTQPGAGPEDVRCEVAFAVKRGFQKGTLLFMNKPVSAVPPEPEEEATEQIGNGQPLPPPPPETEAGKE